MDRPADRKDKPATAAPRGRVPKGEAMPPHALIETGPRRPATAALREAGLAPASAGVVARGLEKSFATPRGAVRAVRGVDLLIERGETVALLGPNGAGKSTTIDMLLGLGRPDAGVVTVFGGTPARAVAAGASGGHAADRRADSRSVGARVRAACGRPLPGGRSTSTRCSRRPASPRSPGSARRSSRAASAQRMRFAAALVSGAALLVLDEPTVGMDVESRHAFWTTIRGVRRGGRDRPVCHALPRRGRRLRRPRGAHGGAARVVADGPATEIKARVGRRVIKATLPGARDAALHALPGVAAVERHGEAVALSCSDSDAALRALLAGWPGARDIEIAGAGLEQAFLELTGDGRPAQRDDTAAVAGHPQERT